MKKLLLSLLVASALAPHSTKALTHGQTECLKAISTLGILAGAIGYVIYKGVTQPHQVTTKSLLTPTQMAQMAWMSTQPRFQHGAVNFQKGSVFPFQGAFNFR